jgi:hypothetical protein
MAIKKMKTALQIRVITSIIRKYIDWWKQLLQENIKKPSKTR